MKFKNMLLLGIFAQLLTVQLAAQSEEKKFLDERSAFVNLLFAYSNTKKENSNTLLENVKSSNATNFSIRTGGGYFFKKYFAAGFGLVYDSEKENAEKINTFGPNTILDRDIQSYTFTPSVRNYLPIGSNDQFFLFTQTGFELKVANGNESTTTGSDTTDAEIKKYEYGIAFTPGVILLLRNGFAVEANVGVLGFKHSKETITPTDGQPPSEVSSTNFNFDINLLKLFLGISYYF